MGNRTMGYRSRRLIAALAAVALSWLPQSALAWGSYGHRTTAAIAMDNVSPATRKAIARLLAKSAELGTPDCPVHSLEDAAVWPDCVRKYSWRYGYTFAWHYQTEPICEEYSARKNCSGGNCVSAQITRNERILADESLPDAVRLQALIFLVHFVGDIHQPLHSGDHEDRGGNDVQAEYGIVPGLNLHWIWDGPMAERAISSAQPSLVRHYSAAEKAALGGGTPADWGRESWQVARDFAYRTAFGRDACAAGAAPLPKDAALTQEVIAESVPVIQKRIEQAGIRMAQSLDKAFAPGPLPETPRG
ncbi:endonuclease [Tsuneonella suprasediminis]|uniref:Endonuclease n=2 Tax=Tsuneonella suprasediminis TaxID=2306996 RepID=A0A419R2M1_9SPHN|nr:endonuclease [Tsuneonella suprasediminis]